MWVLTSEEEPNLKALLSVVFCIDTMCIVGNTGPSTLENLASSLSSQKQGNISNPVAKALNCFVSIPPQTATVKSLENPFRSHL